MTPLKAVLWCAVSSEEQAADDKISLLKQESDARAVCVTHGWQIVDILRMKHSRDYVDVHECAADMRAAGYDAFDRLMEHWRKRDFDVLVCRDAERLGRTQALNAYVVERTIVEAGAQIYTLADGFVDRQRMRMFISFSGYKAAADLDRIVSGRRAAMFKNAQNGIATTSSLPISHKVIRNEKGRNVGTAVDETHLPAIHQAARLVVEAGVRWMSLEQELYDQYGYGEKGRGYTRFKFYDLFYNPIFWGNQGVYWAYTREGRVQPKGEWAFDASAEPPAGATMFYGTHPAALTGELAESLKAELRRRLQFTGRRDYKRSRAFSGLICCDTCLYNMVYHGNKGYPGYKCTSRYIQHAARFDCDNRKYISEKALQSWFTRTIVRLLKSPSAPIIEASDRDIAGQLERTEAELKDAEGRIRKLIELQAAAPESLAELYADQIAQYGRQRDALKAEIAGLNRAAAERSPVDREAALREIEAMSLDKFWTMQGYEINRYLHRIMGNLRLYVRDAKVVDIKPYPSRNSRP
jgi:DNA invertase Pin-like site-specific DNA recombinase